ncbi:deacetylase [Opitutaceae bacterium TAV5]|nr:deacetylase [Opitutaceae bacterium TAV5]
MSFTHDFPFDPTGGYSPEQLLSLRLGEPADFEAFWRETFALAERVPLDWRIRPSVTHPGDARTEVFDVEFASLAPEASGAARAGAEAWSGKNRVGGWLTRPRGRPARRGVVHCHGYGGREGPDLSPPLPEDADAAVIFPCCTGLPTRSLHTGIGSTGGEHVLHGIGNRETYVHRFCAADIWRAASVLLEAVPELLEGRGAGSAGGKLDYIGGSFGGGIGALALPWDARFRRAHLSVPSFGNHPLRLGLPCSGSGESVRLHAQRHPEVREVLAYFDAAVAARRITIPVLVEAAYFDPAVPPAGQFSVYHALGGLKQLHASAAGHFDHAGTPAEQAALRAELVAFFAE